MITMASCQKLNKSGRFCSTKANSKYEKICKMAQKRWCTKKQEENINDMEYIPEPTIDTVNPTHEQTIDQVDCSQEQVDEVLIDIVKHDHQYAQNYEKASIYDDNGIDVHEEEIGDTTMLPKSAVPIDSYKLVVELGHIIKQLKTGCEKCRLSLNICSAQGVQPKGLGGWIYVMCDNPVYKAVNKISIGKQHKSVSKVDNPFNLTRPGYTIFDVNTKAASGMLHAGIGETYLNNLLCAMNIP